MIEDESNSLIYENKNSEHNWKELLYNLFYEIKSEILGTKIEIEEDEYQENLNKITIPKLITYIHDSIQILISHKIEMAKNQQKKEDDNNYILKNNGNGQIPEQISQLNIEEKSKYESIIKKLEEKERFLTKLNFINKLREEAFENKIGMYMDMEDEFEEMKTKLKYEEGRFLKNDRKDNEILILRSENSKMKKIIDELEEKNKLLEKTGHENSKKINALNEEIKNLKIKIEEKQQELNVSQNYLNNLTNNNLKNLKNNNNNDIKKFLLDNDDKNNMTERIRSNFNISNNIEKNEHNNTVKYWKYQNINLHPCYFNKIKKKIYSKKKSEGNRTNNNEKRSTKENTNANINNNNDLISNTRNEFTERLKPKSNKYFSGNNIKKIINNNSPNKKRNYYHMDNSHLIKGKFFYLFNNKNNLSNLSSIKKIIAYGSIKKYRPNSTKKKSYKQKGLTYRSSSGE